MTCKTDLVKVFNLTVKVGVLNLLTNISRAYDIG